MAEINRRFYSNGPYNDARAGKFPVKTCTWGILYLRFKKKKGGGGGEEQETGFVYMFFMAHCKRFSLMYTFPYWQWLWNLSIMSFMEAKAVNNPPKNVTLKKEEC